MDLLHQITCLLFGLFIQPFVDSRFIGIRSSILLQLFSKILGIDSSLFRHPLDLCYERMLVEYGFGVLPLQLSLLIKREGSIFIIDVMDGFRCCPICRLDRRPDNGHFLEACVSIFNVLGLPEIILFLMLITIADVTALSAWTFLAVSHSISKTLASAALTKAMDEAV